MHQTRYYANAVSLVAIGVVIGLVIAALAPLATEVFWDRYDQWNPVIEANAQVTEITPEGVTVHLTGVKHRQCLYVGLSALNPAHNGDIPPRVFIQRVDTPETGETRPLGPLDMGLWRLWPTQGVRHIEIYAQHVCSGRIVVTPVARVDLEKLK